MPFREEYGNSELLEHRGLAIFRHDIAYTKFL